MITEQLLIELHTRGIKLWLDGDRLRYKAPKGALTPDLRQAIGQHKAELLSFLRQAQRTTEPPLQPTSYTGPIPLSFAQQRLWFINQLDGSSPAYNMPSAFQLSGQLEISLLHRSLIEIVRRHAILRTTYQAEDGQPHQVIASEVNVALPVVDLQALPANIQSVEIRRLARAEAQQPFDLTQDLMLRAKLLQASDDNFVLLLTMHHIASDGWSMRVLAQEMMTLYRAFSDNRSPTLPELPIQYADFALWQRGWLAGDRLKKQLAYWRTQLVGSPPLLRLPTDRPRPPVQTYRGANVDFTLPAGLTEPLQQLSQQSGTTLFTIVLAAFKILLARYSGQTDIVVGSSIANRTRLEFEPLIGFFVNTLVLRTDLADDPSFLELIKRLQRMTLEADAHQDLPFELLVDELQPERDPSHLPLFQVYFAWQNLPPVKVELPHLTIAPLAIDSGIAKFDLALFLEERGPGATVSENSGLQGTIEYNIDLFDRATVVTMIDRFQRLLTALGQELTTPVSHLAWGEAISLPPLEAGANVADRWPLSYHQERLWFIDQFETGAVYATHPTYHNIPLIMHLTGQLDPDAIEASLNAIIARHSALRTRIVSQKGHVMQVIRPQVRLKLERVDLATAKAVSPEAVMAQVLDEARRPLALDSDLLVRAVLFQTSQTDMTLLVVVHHIIADRDSIRLIAHEVAAVYRAQATAQKQQLPQPVLQYADYALWQRTLPAEALEPLWFYWRWQLRGRPAALQLPEDHPRPAVHTYTQASTTFHINPTLIEQLRNLNPTGQDNLFKVLLTGFMVLFYRYTRQNEIVVGTTVSGRETPAIEQIVGPLANLIVLRTHLNGNLTFKNFCERVSRVVDEALTHQALPFDKLVQQLALEPDMSRTALFDVLFQVERDDAPTLDFGNGTGRIIDTNLGYGKYDLNIMLHAQSKGWQGQVVYNADIYERPTIEQMMHHFVVILEAMADDSNQRLADVNLLSSQEQMDRFNRWNATQAHSPKDKTIPQLFAEQVQRTPHQMAVLDTTERLTYRQLDERANQVAHHLQAQGVTTETLVAVCLDRSATMIVALLAVLKAGGAYLPLDPSHPAERLRFMVEDAGINHLITTAALVDRIPVAIASTTLLDADGVEISRQPETAVSTTTTPDNLAYCLYTSGSTGQPKGVLIEHRQIVRLLVNDKLPFSFDQADVWTMFHAYTFDFSVWEMYGALLYGGKLVIVPAEVAKDPAQFVDLLIQHGVTVLNQTPTAFFNLMPKLLARSDVKLALRYIIFGGELLQPVQLRRWKTAYPEIKLINMYGITETTVHVTFKEIDHQETEAKVSNIGGPIPTTQLYILDERLQLLPIGVMGELCIAGEGLSRGYLNRAGLTATKFVPNPYQPQTTFYRSGDLGKRLPNGDVIYLGRIDDQVQIRGFRIELGEIRSQLLAHPAIAQVEVITRAKHDKAPTLVAYVVLTIDIDVTDLRAYLAQKLPHYMIPAAFVFMKTLPLTANGKVNRRALPEPDTARPKQKMPFVAPSTPEQKLLATIWADVLRRERVGIHDNFFELGGDSILSIQIVARSHQAGLHLTPKDIFQHQTIAGLASAVQVQETSDRIETSLSDGFVPLTPIQHRFFDQHLSEPHHFNQALRFEVSPATQPERLAHALQYLLRHHDALRLRFVENDSGLQQWYADPAEVLRSLPFITIDLSDLPAPLQRLAIDEGAMSLQTSLDLAQGPMVRLIFYYCGPNRPAVLWWISHHLVIDGVSWRVLVMDLITIYQQIEQGKEIHLPDKTTTFKGWADWLSNYARSEQLAAEIPYWSSLQSVAIQPLPVDHPADRSQNRVASAASLTCRLSVQETQALLQQAPAAYHTQVNDLLLAALLQTMVAWTGQSTLWLELEGHGRETSTNNLDLSRTVGWFTSVFPVLLQLEPPSAGQPTNAHLGTTIKSIKEQLRRVPHGGIGYGLLRYLTQIPELSTLPTAQISFNYLGQFDNLIDKTPAGSFILGLDQSGQAPARSPRQIRLYLLEIDGLIIDGQLSFIWTYSQNFHQTKTIQHLADTYIEALRTLIDHCLSPTAGGYTPSDFAKARVNQEQLDRLLNKLKIKSGDKRDG
ncbi:MAG: amino acid adenylation domain-containing protein [Anaerolineae bacterium]|nr:amino acid adenylation domain-containing protein [Anaerolineae bacterium]